MRNGDRRRIRKLSEKKYIKIPLKAEKNKREQYW